MADFNEPKDPRHADCIEKATALANMGQASDLSEIAAKLHSEFPDALSILYDDRYSHRRVYISELISKRSRQGLTPRAR